MGLEHAQSLLYALAPGTNPLKMGREVCDSLMGLSPRGQHFPLSFDPESACVPPSPEKAPAD